MTSSFWKKGAGRLARPRGTKTSLHNSQLLVSSGVPSLDSLLGGGLAVGSLLLVEEDVFGSYARLMLKLFLSEGVMCGHALFLATPTESPQHFLADLPGAVQTSREASLLERDAPAPAGERPVPRRLDAPAPVGEETVPRRLDAPAPAGEEPVPHRLDAPAPAGEESVPRRLDMKIAWRYQNLAPEQQASPFSDRFGHFFDLTASMPAARLQATNKTLFDVGLEPASSSAELYRGVGRLLASAIIRGGHSVEETLPPAQRSVLRVGLHSLGSPLWLEESGVASTLHPSPSPTLPQLLYDLKAQLRRAYAVAMVTIPTHLLQEAGQLLRLERLCDAVVRLESFSGLTASPLYHDYHGLFHVRKQPRLNSLAAHQPDTLDLAFKLRRNKFSIQKLHLPPELSETASRRQDDTTAPHNKPSSAGRAWVPIGTQPTTTSTTSMLKLPTDF